MATMSAAAAHVFLSTTRFKELVDSGAVTRPATTGAYDLNEVRREMFAHLRSEKGGHGGAALSSERALLAKEQRESITLKNQISRGDFVPLAIIKALLMVMFAVIRERLLTVPGKLADTLAMRTRDEIEEILRAEMIETLDELHDPTAVPGEGGSEDVSRGRKRI